MRTTREDIMGVRPQIGDTIIFNPPYYKGLIKTVMIDISATGLPICIPEEEYFDYLIREDESLDGFRLLTPRTGFVTIRAIRIE